MTWAMCGNQGGGGGVLSEQMARLDGDTKLALDGAGGLREDSQMGGATASADSAAPPMEKHQGDIKFVCHLNQILLHPHHTGVT